MSCLGFRTLFQQCDAAWPAPTGSVPSKAVCREIGSTLWKIGSTDSERMSKKDAFTWQFSQLSATDDDFGARTPPILSKLVELAQAQKP